MAYKSSNFLIFNPKIVWVTEKTNSQNNLPSKVKHNHSGDNEKDDDDQCDSGDDHSSLYRFFAI